MTQKEKEKIKKENKMGSIPLVMKLSIFAVIITMLVKF